MTPLEIVTASRRAIGAESDDKWSDTELYTTLWQCMCEMASKANCIESTATDVSIASTASYTLPATMIEIKRVTYDGAALKQMDMREYDSIVGIGGTASTGTPQYYTVFGSTITLYPIPPANASVIAYQMYALPAVPTAGSTLEIPVKYHWVLVDGLSHRMLPKDTGDPRYPLYQEKWITGLEWVIREQRLRKRAQGFTIVKREEDAITTYLGVI